MKQNLQRHFTHGAGESQEKQLKISRLRTAKAATPVVTDKLILRAFEKYPLMLQELISASIIEYPEWKPFFVLQLNQRYILFEKQTPVSGSISMHTIISELIERAHFRKKL